MTVLTNKKDLIQWTQRGKKAKYLFFWGHQKPKFGVNQSCFSQWFVAPFEIDGHRYPCAEHYMMAQKAKLFGDTEIYNKILSAQSPNKAKALGRQVQKFDQAVWEKYRFDIVVDANMAKFEQHESLKQFLLETGDRILVEASPVDKIWGIGLAADDDKAAKPQCWPGDNLLGFALMVVREKLSSTGSV